MSSDRYEPVRWWVATYVALWDEHERKVEDLMVMMEMDGHRIIDYGHMRCECGNHFDRNDITIIDYRTDAVIAHGFSTQEEAQSAAGKLVPKGVCYDWIANHFHEEIPDTPDVPEGMPESLANVLSDWVTEDMDDAREWSKPVMKGN